MKNNEIVDSISSVLNTRLTTPLYGVFVLSWSALHWELIYTTLFVDQARIWEKYGLLKNEYVAKYFLNASDPYFYASFVAAALMTGFVIWFMPKWIGTPAFKKDQEHRYDRKRISVEYEKNLQADLTKLEQQSVKKLEATEDRVKKVKEIAEIDPSFAWDREYSDFKAHRLFRQFQHIIDAVYSHNGNIQDNYDQYEEVYEFQIPTDILVYSDTNELIGIDRKTKTIDLTEKGKYFVKKYATEPIMDAAAKF